MDLLTRTIGENIAIEQRLSDNLWAVAADQTQLDTALLNLAINARDAMPDGGKLVFESSNIHVDKGCAQLSGEVAPGDYVSIAVSDTGTGIPPDKLARIFEPARKSTRLNSSH